MRPYILAGGKSSRMGRDKAMLELEGTTLLARAVEMLRSVERLQSQDGSVQVTVCGEREALGGADRAIVDRYPECGPLGGIEAALRDLESGDEADWAFFIPVDMPMLSSELVDLLLAGWERQVEGAGPVRACLVELQGRAQPLVSLIHRGVLAEVRSALEAGRYKVVPVLQSVGAYCTSIDQEIHGQMHEDRAGVTESLFGETSEPHGASVKQAIWSDNAEQPARSEDRFRKTCEQFINVNTEADLMRVATLLAQKGLNN